MQIDDRLRDFLYRYDKALPLATREDLVEETHSFRKLHVTFTSTHEGRVPATVYLPRVGEGPFPALLLQHGASSSKDEFYIQQPSRRWCDAGYVCMAIDAPGHGERALEGPVARRALWRPGVIHRMRQSS